MILTLNSCEEVVELDLSNNEIKPVIEANIFVGETNYNKIRVYYSSGFYSNSYAYINDAIVTITSIETGEVYSFTYDENGYYSNEDFSVNLNHNYKLNVQAAGAIYEAYSKVWSAPEITGVSQNENMGFAGNKIEVSFSYTDNAATEDYYLKAINDDFEITSDRFTNGVTQKDFIFLDEDERGDTLQFSISNISPEYYQYLNKLFSSSANIGNPFASPIGRVYGNIQNLSNKDQSPLGYFHIAKRNSFEYIVK